MTPDTNVTFTWNGSEWEIQTEGEVPAIPVGTKIQWTLPGPPAPPEASAANRKSDEAVLLLPKGEWLYLKVSGQKGGDEAAVQWFQHRQDVRPPLRKTPDEPWVPIFLDEDLRINPDSRRLYPCNCSIGDSAFPSLNEAGQEAHRRWSNREANALNVFNEVRFIHDGILLQLGVLRMHVLDDIPLPAADDEDAGQSFFEDFE